ncbi:MAG TPA: glycosyltransferase [Anaerolineae bacterium]|nr:glycosyltransferase [Anaerolineae bacterium]
MCPSDVSVIVTVKDEAASIDGLLHSLARQTVLPSEVVIVDGGSTDGTVERIENSDQLLPIKLLVRDGANISQGRNEAIRAACGQIIASTDAGVSLVPQWLEELTRPLDEDPTIDVVSGFFLPDPKTPFEVAMGATVLPVEGDVDPKRFLPSSRSVAFRREAWEKVGGYPEWLDFCEDLVFDFALLDSGHKFHFAPEAVAYFRPRGSLRAFGRQYYQYARGDGKADLWRRRHATRYLTYLVGIPLVVTLGVVQHPVWWVMLIGGAAAYLWTPYRRLWPLLRGLPLADKIKAILWVPIIRLWGDLAKMVGYPVGVLWRMRHRDLFRPHTA